MSEKFFGYVTSNADDIRSGKLNEGIKGLKSSIRNMDIEVGETPIQEKKEAPKKYTKEEISSLARDLYKNIKPPKPVEDSKEDNEKVVAANTQAMRANYRALARTLTGYRNGGDAGQQTHFTRSANGDAAHNTGCNYGALVVAGTEMTLEQYKEHIDAKMEACWAGYTQKGTKTMFGKQYPNCVKKTKTKKEEVETEEETSQEFLTESDVISELKEQLLELDDTSWVAIDSVMRAVAKEHSMTPKELHKLFKKENEGQIPDEWLKENQTISEAGWMPLEEMVGIYRNGVVYDVSLMWKGHSRRLKFFWPEKKLPDRNKMEETIQMFYPGGRLLTFYPSHDPGDQTDNFMVLVPPMTENCIFFDHDDWHLMTEEESLAYDYILNEEGEPTSPPLMREDGLVEIWIEDHDTGEEKIVVFNEEGLHAWFNKSKSKDGKPGWVQSDGSPCANEKGETKTPKCYSSAKKASMTKKELKSADARKSRQDPNQQQKSGAAKPTYVRTDKKESVETYGEILEGKKDACYHKVKSRYKVWPSAYASGALVKCRKSGAKSWGNSSKKEEVEYVLEDDMKGMSVKSGHKRSVAQGAGLTEKGAAAYRRKNPGSKLGTAVTTPPSKLKPGSKAAGRRKSFCARSRGWTGERGKAARARWNC